MKDVEKTNVERDNSSKRMRRRKRHMKLYIFVVVFLVFCIIITLSCTLLFNIKQITVTANETINYTPEQIVQAANVKTGDNMILLKSSEAEANILKEMRYIEKAEVHKKFPSTLEIKVEKCVPAYNITYEMGTLVVSRNGKILENNGVVTDGLPVVKGFVPSTTAPGQKISSNDVQQQEIYDALTKKMKSKSEFSITGIDMTDKYETIVTYSNGIIFKMGNWTDIPYKLSLAENVMKKVGNTPGYIMMIGTNQCSFRTTQQSGFETTISPTVTTAVTDANGNTITETTTAPDDTANDTASDETTETSYANDEERMFQEHDAMVRESEAAMDSSKSENNSENENDNPASESNN